jgi:sRNA-binding protein
MTDVQTLSSKQRRHLEAQTTIELLAATYPTCFAVLENRRKPIAVGIHLELQQALGEAITPRELGYALRLYTGNQGYLQRMVVGAWRIGLDGQQRGTVTEQEAQTARTTLQCREEKLKRRKESSSVTGNIPPEKQSKQPAKPLPAVTRPASPANSSLKASLAALKEAGKRRREMEDKS